MVLIFPKLTVLTNTSKADLNFQGFDFFLVIYLLFDTVNTIGRLYGSTRNRRR